MRKLFLKLISVFTITCILCSSVETNVFAQTEKEQNDGKETVEVLTVSEGNCETIDENLFAYELDENGNSTITEYKGTATEVIIPDSLGGTKVVAIGKLAFAECVNLTSVVIPNSVTSIGEKAFYKCSGLKSIVISESITSIEASVFYGCSSLTRVTIPAGVTIIGESAFYGCSSLSNVTIPDSVTIIEDFAFCDCRNLISVTIPKDVQLIRSHIFDGCSSLTSVIIPEGVVGIESFAFDGCSSLTNVTIPDGVTRIEDFAFAYCSSLISVIIPDSVKYIGSYAFVGCSSMTSITLSDNVTSIQSYAFAGCSSLTSVTIPVGVSYIGDRAFSECSNMKKIIFEGNLPKVSNNAFSSGTLKIGYYTDNNATWLDVVESTFFGGGTFKWKAMCSGEHSSAAVVKENEQLATCSKMGSYEEVVYCSVCEVEISRKIRGIALDSSNHVGVTEVRNVHEATCAEEGYTGDIYCKSCNGKISEGIQISMIEHVWDEGAIIKDATATNEGERVYTCTRCRATKLEVIPIDSTALVPSTSIKLNKTKVTLDKGKTITLTATVVPERGCREIDSPKAGRL